MAQVLVPGVAQLVMSGTNFTQPWTCVIHWQFGGTTANWSQANIQLLADTWSSAWNTYAAPHTTTQTIMNSVLTTDIGSSTPAGGSNTTSRAGTAASPAFGVSSTCAVISFRIPARYRGGHPRIYLPWGTTGDGANEYAWTPTAAQNFQVAFTNMVSAVVTALPGSGSTAAQHCVPTYTYTLTDDPVKHKYHRTRSGLKAVYVVQNYLGQQPLGTQRRRLTLTG